MRKIPRPSNLPYFTIPGLSEPSLAGMGAGGPGTGMQNIRNGAFNGPVNNMTSVRGRMDLPGSFAIPNHLGAVPNRGMAKSGHRQIGMEGKILNHGYYRQQECCNHNHMHPHHGVIQHRLNIDYQQRQQITGRQPFTNFTAVGMYGLQAPQYNEAGQLLTDKRNGLQPNQFIGQQFFSPNLTAVEIHEQQASQCNAEAAQQMINQRTGLQPYQLGSNPGFRESDLKRNYNCSSRPADQPQLLFNQSKAIQESQGPMSQGTKDSPIMMSEESKECLDELYQKIQKCKEECLQDILTIYRHFVSRMPQVQSGSEKMHESFAKKVVQFEGMINLLNQQRGSMEHRDYPKIHKTIDNIYAFTQHMRNKWSMLFPKPRGEQLTVSSTIIEENLTDQKQDLPEQEAATVSEADNNVLSPLQPATSTDSHPTDAKFDNGEQQMVPSTITVKNHTDQKHDLPELEAAACSEAENNVLSPLQPAKTSTDTHPTEASADAQQSKNLYQETVNQLSPIDRLVKAVKEATPEVLIHSSEDIISVITAADRIPEIAPYRDGHTYRCDDLAACPNYDLHTKEVPNQRMKRNFSAVVHDIYDVVDGGRVDSRSRVCNKLQSFIEKSKRQKVEGNKTLMTEIDYLKGKLFETQVAIEKPDADSQTMEDGNDITVSCTFVAVGYEAVNILSYLFPVRMQLKIPRDYPQSQPAVLPCRHQNCGTMCAMLQTKYEPLSREMKSVKEAVLEWHECARDLYKDISLGPCKIFWSSKWEPVVE